MVSFDSGPSVHWLNEVSMMNFESPMSLVSLRELTMLAGATLCRANPGLIVRVLAGQIEGVADHIAKEISASLTSKIFSRMIAEPEWLGLCAESLAPGCTLHRCSGFSRRGSALCGRTYRKENPYPPCFPMPGHASDV